MVYQHRLICIYWRTENKAIDKGLISQINEQLIQLNIGKTIQSKKWAEDLNRHFFPRRYTSGQEAHEKIQIITQYYRNQNSNEISPYTSPEGHDQGKKKNPQTINAGEGMEKREPSYTVSGDVN